MLCFTSYIRYALCSEVKSRHSCCCGLGDLAGGTLLADQAREMLQLCFCAMQSQADHYQSAVIDIQYQQMNSRFVFSERLADQSGPAQKPN